MNNYLIQHYLEHTANKYGSKKAVFFKDKSISFRELNHRSNGLANRLKSKGVQRGQRVLIYLDKSISSIIAMVGVLKADAIYVPIDVKTPFKRLTEIADGCKPMAIICDEGSKEASLRYAGNCDHEPFVVVLGGKKDQNRESDKKVVSIHNHKNGNEENILSSNIDKDLAYILYTSGSTGKPKGVMISHANVKNYIDWAIEYFDIKESDNILNTSPLHFDMSLFDIYCSLATGATLTLVPKTIQMFPVKVMETIEKRRITIWKAVSFLLAYFVKTKFLRPNRMPELEKVIFSGEPLHAKYLREWMRAYPKKKFFNAYGPTETTGISVCYRISQMPRSCNDKIPIGKACSNTEIFVVNENGRPVQPGEIGELYIRGSGLSKGYWADPEKTREVFIDYPISDACSVKVFKTGDFAKLLPSGELDFIGRKDQQIKRLGYRIELGEIEKALCSLLDVCDAAVIPIAAGAEDEAEIIAFVESSNGFTASSILSDLRSTLPYYMIPQCIEMVERLPRTDNQKIDRQRLRVDYLRNLAVKKRVPDNGHWMADKGGGG